MAGAVCAERLDEGFVSPPEATKPRCYWYWMNGQISKEGITKDLEAMREVGIGEGYIGVIDGGDNIKALSEPWWGFLEHAVREGTRLGVDVGVFNCPGWSQSGGPWIKPGQSMRYVVLPETRVTGPQRFPGKLAAPPDFQDLAVLAFPAPACDADTAAARGARVDRTPTQFTFALPESFTARSVTVRPSGKVRVTADLQTSADGQTYRSLRVFPVDRHNLGPGVGPVPLAPVTISFPAVTARFFRVAFSGPAAIADVELSAAARVESVAEKQLAKVFQDPLPPFDIYSWPPAAEPDRPGLAVDPASVLNLSGKLAADGTLAWDVPAGEWIVLRAGLAPTGTKNSPAPPEATGLEVDKMNRTALAAHFDAYVGELLRRVPAAERTALKHVVADSYEMGPQNWTDDFAPEFTTRYGYDPLRFLPSFSGRVVGSADQSDRFLWDVRRLVADRVARDYVGGLSDLCRKHGLKMWLENYGHWGFPGEFLQYGGYSDEIGGEFWVSGDLGTVELRCASSAANTYGFPATFAEAFTGGPLFQSTPWSLKARGDWAFCQGINQFVLHVNIHQPSDGKRPGVSAWFGTEFNRHNTWFPRAKPWIDYLRRCHFMLQQGHHVADVAYFIGEDAPKMTGLRRPELPAGYDFDYINADVLKSRARVRDGRLALDSGARYRLLVLPPSETMRPELLKVIAGFVDDGLAVVGPAPLRSPSLRGYPACDAEVRQLADRLWGRGLIVNTNALSGVLERIGAPADLTGVDPARVLFTHRRSEQADIYFLSNQADAPVLLSPGFRVTGRTAELWDPVTGGCRSAPGSMVVSGRTQVALSLPPRGSTFVVFRDQPAASRPAEPVGRLIVTRAVYEAVDGAGATDVTAVVAGRVQDGTLKLVAANDVLGGDPALQHVKRLRVQYTVEGQPAEVAVPENGMLELPPGEPLPGPWQLAIAGKEVVLDKLASWTELTDPDLKYFSGTATYRTAFNFPHSAIGNRQPAILLDLGPVRDIAHVRLNGRDLGGVWCAPWQIDLTPALQAGTNALEIAVVNTWNNRLVGDAALPVDQRKTWASHQPVRANSPLQPAGLLGPVTLRRAAGRESGP